jgi:hypothetical protein
VAHVAHAPAAPELPGGQPVQAVRWLLKASAGAGQESGTQAPEAASSC